MSRFNWLRSGSFGRKPTVAIVGDSNVERFPPIHPFLNLGKTHTTSKEFAERLGPALTHPSATAVTQVVIWGPTNDIHYWNGNRTRFLRIAGLAAQERHCTVILCTVCPHIDQSQPARGRTHAEVKAAIKALNIEITALGRSMNWPIVDCYSPLVDERDDPRPEMFIPEDGVPPTLLHLSALGRKTCLKAIRDQLQTKL
jgi:hypothetical protein